MHQEFHIYKTPIIRNGSGNEISNIYQAGDEKKKSGDDYPLRIYVLFPKYNPRGRVFERALRS